MSTVLNNPLYIDGASEGALITTSIMIQAIFWQAEADGNTIVLNDQKGNVIWQSTIFASAGESLMKQITFPFGLRVDGLAVETIDGGIALVYLA